MTDDAQRTLGDAVIADALSSCHFVILSVEVNR